MGIRIKHNSDGSINKYKVCLIIKGFHQYLGVDFIEIFNHVVKHITIKTTFTIALGHNWPLHQLDVECAFLHIDCAFWSWGLSFFNLILYYFYMYIIMKALRYTFFFVLTILLSLAIIILLSQAYHGTRQFI